MAKRDYYEVLGVEKDATKQQIKKAFRKLAMTHHPDRGGKEEDFKEINEAYSILSDEKTRTRYDQYGFDGIDSSSMNFNNFGSFDDIINMFFGGSDPFSSFGGGFGGRSQKRRQRGGDIEKTISISFKEAVTGVKKEITFQKDEPCHHCNGTGAESRDGVKKCSTCGGRGQVTTRQRGFMGIVQQITTCPDCHGEGEIIKKKCKECRGRKVIAREQQTKIGIPAGVESGMHLKVSGHGHVPTRDAVPGDLYVQINVKEDPYFKRDDNDIIADVDVDFITAITGGNITVKTLDGKREIKIKPGTQSETYIRRKGEGFPSLNSMFDSVGDLYYKINIIIPKYGDLSKKQKQLIDDYSTTIH